MGGAHSTSPCRIQGRSLIGGPTGAIGNSVLGGHPFLAGSASCAFLARLGPGVLTTSPRSTPARRTVLDTPNRAGSRTLRALFALWALFALRALITHRARFALLGGQLAVGDVLAFAAIAAMQVDGAAALLPASRAPGA